MNVVPASEVGTKTKRRRKKADPAPVATPTVPEASVKQTNNGKRKKGRTKNGSASGVAAPPVVASLPAAKNGGGAVTPPTVAGRSKTSGVPLAVGPSIVGFEFDGMDLDRAIATVPVGTVIAYGVFKDNGLARSGELWFVVSREKRDVYYHLVDTKEKTKSDGNYNGYRVQLKGQRKQKYFPLGAGASAPLFGNGTDSFAVSEWTLFANSTLTGPDLKDLGVAPPSSQSSKAKTAAKSAPSQPTGSSSNSTTLVAAGTLVQSARFTPSGAIFLSVLGYTTAGSPTGAATETLLERPPTAYSTASEADCAAYRKDVEDALNTSLSVTNYVAGTTLAAVSIGLALRSGGAGSGSAVQKGVALLTPLLSSALAGMGLPQTALLFPLLGFASESVCNALNDEPVDPGIGRPTITRPEFLGPSLFAVLVCLQYGGGFSTGDYTTDTDGTTMVVVTYHALYCVLWGFLEA